MSIQSDIEMISIQVTEIYAARNLLSVERTIELFHKHQIFEKIIIQHEYLHQVSMEEILEFVDTEVSENARDLILFHGTTAEFEKVDLQKSHNRRDFGSGFYTTVLKRQAKEWGYRLSLREKMKTYYVYQFRFSENDNLRIKRFDTLNEEWLEFIKENRSKGGLRHDFDVVIGPVADDNTMETVQLYISGILTAQEAMTRLRYSQVNNQVSFHTEKALQYVEMIGREDYE